MGHGHVDEILVVARQARRHERRGTVEGGAFAGLPDGGAETGAR